MPPSSDPDRPRNEIAELTEALAESTQRERELRARLVDERDRLEDRLEVAQSALRIAWDTNATRTAEAELLRERAARAALEEHVRLLRAEIAERTRRATGRAPGSGNLPVDYGAESGTGAVDTLPLPSPSSEAYETLFRGTVLEHLEERERALPWPIFVHSPRRNWPPRASVIICVHNALEDVRVCLASVARTLTVDAEVILVDDGSDTPTASFLDLVAASHHRVRLVRNDGDAHGYTIAANLGMRAASGRYLVLLNSDTIASDGWLERLIAAVDDDPTAGIVGPISNAASHQSVPEVRDEEEWATNPLPPWLPVAAMATGVECVSRCERPRVPFLNGFCYAVKREVLEAVGYFDEELFPEGYCEENDYSLRARAAGFDCVVADDVFVYHAKSRSYTPEGRAAHAKRNYATFLEKHGAERVETLLRDLGGRDPLAELRARLREALQDPAAFVEATHKRLEGPLRTVFVLPGISAGGSGGSHSVFQEVQALRDLGVQATIAIPRAARELVHSTYGPNPSLFVEYADERSLSRVVAASDLLVATHSDSVPLVAQAVTGRPDLATAYYVQDYEPLFRSTGSAQWQRAIASYTALPRPLVFAKTHWLCNVLSAVHGVPVAKVEPSLDHATYFPPDSARPPYPVVVAAMVRPRTPRRRAEATVRLLDRLADALGDGVEVVTFGCEREALDRLTESRAVKDGHAGLLKRDQVAALLRRAHVFVDHSTYQAFGRTALEAMACGCVPVVPLRGGAWEFTVPGVNALVCDTCDAAATHSAVSSLLRDGSRLEAMRAQAQSTAARYSTERAAVSIFALFAGAIVDAKRQAPTEMS